MSASKNETVKYGRWNPSNIFLDIKALVIEFLVADAIWEMPYSSENCLP